MEHAEVHKVAMRWGRMLDGARFTIVAYFVLLIATGPPSVRVMQHVVSLTAVAAILIVGSIIERRVRLRESDADRCSVCFYGLTIDIAVIVFMAGLLGVHTATSFSVLAVVPLMVMIRVLMARSITAARQEKQRKQRLASRVATELRRADELARAEEVRHTYLAAVSHELRTPLTSILGYAMTLQDLAGELTPAHRMFLDQIALSSNELDRMLRDLLDLERLTRGRGELTTSRCEMNAMIEEVAQRVADREHRSVIVDYDHQLMARVDEFKVERIIENLVANAFKYADPETPVLVAVDPDDDGAGMTIRVDDSGPGVPTHLRERIFQAFDRGDAESTSVPGMGIGLSLVSRFAQMHGGRAWVEDRDSGRGASFRVWLPTGVSSRHGQFRVAADAGVEVSGTAIVG